MKPEQEKQLVEWVRYACRGFWDLKWECEILREIIADLSKDAFGDNAAVIADRVKKRKAEEFQKLKEDDPVRAAYLDVPGDTPARPNQ